MNAPFEENESIGTSSSYEMPPIPRSTLKSKDLPFSSKPTFVNNLKRIEPSKGAYHVTSYIYSSPSKLNKECEVEEYSFSVDDSSKEAKTYELAFDFIKEKKFVNAKILLESFDSNSGDVAYLNFLADNRICGLTSSKLNRFLKNQEDILRKCSPEYGIAIIDSLKSIFYDSKDIKQLTAILSVLAQYIFKDKNDFFKGAPIKKASSFSRNTVTDDSLEAYFEPVLKLLKGVDFYETMVSIIDLSMTKGFYSLARKYLASLEQFDDARVASSFWELKARCEAQCLSEKLNENFYKVTPKTLEKLHLFSPSRKQNVLFKDIYSSIIFSLNNYEQNGDDYRIIEAFEFASDYVWIYGDFYIDAVISRAKEAIKKGSLCAFKLYEKAVFRAKEYSFKKVEEDVLDIFPPIRNSSELLKESADFLLSISNSSLVGNTFKMLLELDAFTSKTNYIKPELFRPESLKEKLGKLDAQQSSYLVGYLLGIAEIRLETKPNRDYESLNMMFRDLIQYRFCHKESLKEMLCDWSESIIKLGHFDDAKDFLAFCLKECGENFRAYMLLYAANKRIKDINKAYKSKDSFSDKYYLAAMQLLKEENASLYKDVLLGKADLRKKKASVPEKEKEAPKSKRDKDSHFDWWIVIGFVLFIYGCVFFATCL